MIYLQLFLVFLKIGCFSFGGAYGAIPLIRDQVLAKGWLDDESLSYMIGVSESTPGPIMLNLATYVGISQAGVLGAIISNLAVVFPSFLIILLVTAVFTSLLKKKYFQMALKGVKPCIVGIITATGLFMIAQRMGFFLKEGESSFELKIVILTVALALFFFGTKFLLKKKISPIIFILISAGSGVILNLLPF